MFLRNDSYYVPDRITRIPHNYMGIEPGLVGFLA